MLRVCYGEQSEEIVGINARSSSFAACVATLANPRMGLRPHVPAASARAGRTQLLLAGVYCAGVGVAREIVALPAPRVLRLYAVETGESVGYADEQSTLVLSLDTASVSSVERLRIGGSLYELAIEQFIDAPHVCAVSTSISLRHVGGAPASQRLRLDYGVDDSAMNEYLGACDWLTARHYALGPSLEDRTCFSVSVATPEHRLRYAVAIDAEDHDAVSIVSWCRPEGGCVASLTFDFTRGTEHRCAVSWRVDDEAPDAACPLSASVPDRDAHQTRWQSLWKDHEVSVDSKDARVDLGMKYAVFQLLQHGCGSAGTGRRLVSAARGLTSTYHSGATFFDTELHKCLFWIWNDPAVARALLDYRYDFLEKAMQFARTSGFAGARFPEAANDQGTENGPHYVLSYPDQEVRREWSVEEVLHISADVCYALNKYWIATGDDAYMVSRGFRMLVECARFAASVFKWSPSKNAWVVESVMGPDEYHYHVDNSFFTNFMLRWSIRLALSLRERMGFPSLSSEEIAQWQTIADNVYLPWMDVKGVRIPEEFEGYAQLPDTRLRVDKKRGPQFADASERENAEKLHNFESRLVKQADIILLMALFPDEFSAVVKRASFDYYEPRTVHESSLSYGPHAVVAAHLGACRTSADFIERASRYNLDFTPVDDYSNGLHLSAYAGAWQGLVEGLAGLEVREGALSFQPRLPEGWNACHFALWFRGQRLRVSILGNGEIEIRRGDRLLATRLNPDGRIGLKEGCP